ncbi:MAG: ATP-binding protein [Bacteroidales bacterium]
MINRDLYLSKLMLFKDKPLIKVITGIRRCGKSSLLGLFTQALSEQGVDASRIIHLNFESFQFSDIRHAQQLYSYIKDRIISEGKYYIVLDEIQEVIDWEKGVNALAVDLDTDIYISGSNSHLLSGELATFLAGRYIQIDLYPLSFKEYLYFRKINLKNSQGELFAAFNDYLRYGGFPVIHLTKYSLETAWKIVADIYSSAILRDTVQRHNIRDVELLERVVRYIFDNIGNIVSAKSIADYFKSQQRGADINTIYNYLNALEGAFILHKVNRYDIKGKAILKTLEKYYVADLSLIYARTGYRDRMIAGFLENIVYLELRRSGYNVYVGKLDTREVDFIAERGNEKLYIQVCYKIESSKTQDREFAPLLAIKDHHPKLVISMDELWKDNIEGVQSMHIAEFLTTYLE